MTRPASQRVDPVRLPDEVRRALENRMVDAFERTVARLASTESQHTARQYEALRKAALAVIRGVPV